MKMAFWGMLVVGFVGCTTLGIGRSLERASGDWTSPTMLAGSVLGVAIIGLAVAFATGFRPQLLPTDTSMVIALVLLIGGKVGVSLAQIAFGSVSRG